MGLHRGLLHGLLRGMLGVWTTAHVGLRKLRIWALGLELRLWGLNMAELFRMLACGFRISGVVWRLKVSGPVVRIDASDSRV